MALVLNDEQTMLRDTARSFLASEAPVAALRQLRDANVADGFSRELWKQFAGMGFAGVLIPEDFGGVGLGHVEAGVVAEEIGRNLAATPFLSTAVLTASALLNGGSDAQKAAWLPKIAGGEIIGALAVDEGAKHRPEKTALQATRTGNGFTLNGAKTFVVDGHVADLLVVAARTSGQPGETQGLTLFLVAGDAGGVSRERTVMVDAHNAARVNFDNVQVDADAALGPVDGGYELLERVLNVGRAVLAAELSGVGGQAFDIAQAYVKERSQFGRIIGEFQALQHRSAHLFSELEVTRAAVIKALQTLDASPEKAATIVAVAKARAGASTELAVQEGVQMHGGNGMTDAFDIGLYMKRARVAQELLGDSNFHADRLARANGY
ncbi:isovaleryl-CoA dehydrogenase [Camelimonas fluminis]|uniref:Acyl-CoA dehydrogenase family protein n=1 Tax=Camelimonas fluminis TaxID=1576911 RepID=A0ABV7UDB8_9HYPH|nr:acyl-CoA dehydrogenase family protein [Camelimonas fluminis]GHE46482.1 isovaleryl-CoA dehydrogenase [Camelimonas fluminis]